MGDFIMNITQPTLRIMKRKRQNKFPIIGLDFAPKQDEEVDILSDVIEEGEPASKKLKSTMNQVQCKLCFEHFTSQVQLAGHNCRGIRILDYKCSICDRNFMSSANLASHMKWHDQQGVNNNLVDEKKTREEYCLACNKAFTSKAYLQRHIQVIHKKLNQIPNEDRKCRSRKRPLGSTKRPIESINAKNFYVENLLKKDPVKPKRPTLSGFDRLSTFTKFQTPVDRQCKPKTDASENIHVEKKNVKQTCLKKNFLIQCSVLQNLVAMDSIWKKQNHYISN